MGFEKIIVGVCLAVGLIALISILMILPTYFLWNWLMPQIFGLQKISMFQALGLNILCSILFKSSSSSE